MQKGKFICFEGMDFAGKTTMLKKTAEILDLWGIEYITTREPGGSTLGEAVRGILINGTDLTKKEEALLFQAARSHHCRTVIQPALDAGKWVLSDRYIGSSYVYQRDAMDILKHTTKSLDLLEPDAIIYARCSFDEIIRRKSNRSATEVTAMDERYTEHYQSNIAAWDDFVLRCGDLALSVDTMLPSTTNIQLIRNWITQKLI